MNTPYHTTPHPHPHPHPHSHPSPTPTPTHHIGHVRRSRPLTPERSGLGLGLRLEGMGSPLTDRGMQMPLCTPVMGEHTYTHTHTHPHTHAHRFSPGSNWWSSSRPSVDTHTPAHARTHTHTHPSVLCRSRRTGGHGSERKHKRNHRHGWWIMLLAMQQADTSGITRDSRNGGGGARLALYFYLTFSIDYGVDFILF